MSAPGYAAETGGGAHGSRTKTAPLFPDPLMKPPSLQGQQSDE